MNDVLRDQNGQEVYFQGSSAESVTPSDTATFDAGVLYVGTGGDVNVTTVKGDTVVFKNIPNGAFLPVVVKAVKSTSTTASDILVVR